MFRRRPLMRAAVVGGGAYMAGKHMANKQTEQAQYEAEQDDRISQLEQQQYQDPSQQYQQPPPPQGQAPPPQYQQPPAQQAPAAPGTSSMVDQLNQLADLHQRGVLSDDEFAAAKAKLFGS
jgi:Short C-terminal domain